MNIINCHCQGQNRMSFCRLCHHRRQYDNYYHCLERARAVGVLRGRWLHAGLQPLLGAWRKPGCVSFHLQCSLHVFTITCFWWSSLEFWGNCCLWKFLGYGDVVMDISSLRIQSFIVRFDKQVFISGGRPWVKTCAHWTRHESKIESHGEHHCRCHLHSYCLAMIAIANSSVTIIVIIIAIVIYTVIIMPSPLPSSLRPSLTSPLPSLLSSSLPSPHISSVFLYVHHHKIHDLLISLSWPQKSLYD